MKYYSFLNTVLLVNGVSITGFDEGDDSIAMDRSVDSMMHKVGTDGEMSVALTSDRSGGVVFRINQTSDSNAYLSGLIIAAENGAFVPVFVQFKDTKGGDLGSGTRGYVLRPAAMTRGTNTNAQEWTIIAERLDLLHNGA